MTPKSRILALFAAAGLTSVVSAAANAAAYLPDDVNAIHQRSIDDGVCQGLGILLTNYKIVVQTLSPTDTLYIVPCDFGIVNAAMVLYLDSTGDHPGVMPLMFAQYDQDFGWIADIVQFNPVFDPATKTLTADEFYDPAGDCGALGTWQWKDYAFAMVEYRFQAACDRTQAYPKWPVIWTSPQNGAAPRPLITGVPDFFQTPN